MTKTEARKLKKRKVGRARAGILFLALIASAFALDQRSSVKTITVSSEGAVVPDYVFAPMGFMLQATSPCIGAGTPVGVTTDFFGLPVDSVHPAMGAIEYREATPAYIASVRQILIDRWRPAPPEPPSNPANHYVDSKAAGGGDGSIGAPWNTLAAVYAHTLAAGDSVYLKRGSKFRERLTLMWSGTSGHRITYTAYGSGALPRIYGSTQVATWTGEGGNLWYATCTALPKSVWTANTDATSKWGEKQSAKASLNAEYEWWWDDPNDRLYVYAASDPDSRYESVEKNTRGYGIDLNGQDYITLSYLDISFCGLTGDSAGIFNQSAYADHPIIEYCNLHHNGNLVADPNPDGNGALLKNTNNGIIRFTNAYQNGRRGLCLFSDGSTHTANNNLIEFCISYDNKHAGIDVFLGSGSAQVDGNIIRYNRIYLTSAYREGWTAAFNCHGILIQSDLSGPKVTNTQVYYNVLSNLTEGGISPKGCNGIAILNNVIYGHHADATWAPGIVLYGDSAAHANNAVTLKNNLTSNNVVGGLYVHGTNTNTTCDYNCWYGGTGTYAYVNGTTYGSANFATYKSATGWDAHGKWANPLMVNPQ